MDADLAIVTLVFVGLVVCYFALAKPLLGPAPPRKSAQELAEDEQWFIAAAKRRDAEAQYKMKLAEVEEIDRLLKHGRS